MQLYKTGQAAKYLNVHTSTLIRWDFEGTFKADRTATGRRVYTQEKLDAWINTHGKLVFTPVPGIDTRKVVAYARVSTDAQRPDLQRQREAIGEFVTKAGIANTEIISEVGGGLNWKRQKFLEIADGIENGMIGKLILAHKDRWVRFGFDYWEVFCAKHQCSLVIINNETLSPEEEMTQDLMSVMHCFSSRLYGLRKYSSRKKIETIIK
jgi:predicted site-specific integrase-resolvase